jgi:DNA-binding NarL/FixJ family response regulator
MASIKLLLVDDHAVVRQSLRRVLDKQPGLVVVGEAGDGREAIEQAEALRPDVVLMDAAMPGLGGIEATRRLRMKVPGARVVVLSQHTDQATVADALEAGAMGFVAKTDGLEELERAIRAVAADKHYLSPDLSGFLIRSYLEGQPPGAGASAAWRTLTEREREVVQLVAEGHNSKSMSELLGMSQRTVESHRRRIYQKLGFSDTAGLTRWALRHRLVPPDP